MNFFSVRAVDGWKVIPSEMKMVKNVHQVKKKYKDHRRSREGL
jgi:hypothetical protein